ncbi:hypothetical protein [Streptomyces sp. 1331.2]|uniref:hypothetical protein n=1 Tax=Streptomyces sp. 1331.2 TaxID=1938835 RepID=UPI000BDBE145|nr:hypothetical protein [Streptomyces sp. 1331.2]SOB84743.1 hypothetical protein SAMN06272789_5004 [Streptomyces sp. 1331.2]
MGRGSTVQEAGTRPEDRFEQWREAIRRTRECEATSARAEFLFGLDRRAADLQPAEASRLGAVLVDLVAARLARELDAGSAPARDVRQRTVVEDVRAFIRQNPGEGGP